MEELINKLNIQFANSSVEEVLQYFLTEYKGEIGLSSSLSYEDQVLTHIICGIDKTAKIFTLDTGRFFPETYSLIDNTNLRYGIKIQVYFPDNKAVEKMVSEHGVNLFYESVTLRHLCCNVRKIEPLKRALKSLKVWITGLRRSQSVTRKNMQLVEYDHDDNIIKLNPLINWSEDDVKNFVKVNHIPYNKLHDKGFPSIGCQPCTRAVKNGEDIRSGRWWWENPEHRECGLHQRE